MTLIRSLADVALAGLVRTHRACEPRRLLGTLCRTVRRSVGASGHSVNPLISRDRSTPAAGATAVAICDAERTDVTAPAAIGRAVHSMELALQAGKAPEWIHLLPAGTFAGRDGRGPYRLDDGARVIAASLAAGERLPIDYDHATDLGRQAPAAGWIEELEARQDGIWGRVVWTDRGAAAIESLEYRHASPVFRFDKGADGSVLQILRAALTNSPNLPLTALASAATGDHAMTPQEITQLWHTLGLTADADAAAMIDRAGYAVQAASALEVIGMAAGLGEHATADDIVTALASRIPAIAAMGQIAKAVGLAEHATADDIVTAVQAKATGTVDPARYVPVEAMTALQAQVAELQSERAVEKATAAVDAAIEDGRLTPAQRDWGLALHAKDPESFAAFVAKAPRIVASGRVLTIQPAGDGGAGGLAPDELAICSSLGVKPEDFKREKAALAATGVRQ